MGPQQTRNASKILCDHGFHVGGDRQLKLEMDHHHPSPMFILDSTGERFLGSLDPAPCPVVSEASRHGASCAAEEV